MRKNFDRRDFIKGIATLGPLGILACMFPQVVRSVLTPTPTVNPNNIYTTPTLTPYEILTRLSREEAIAYGVPELAYDNYTFINTNVDGNSYNSSGLMMNYISTIDYSGWHVNLTAGHVALRSREFNPAYSQVQVRYDRTGGWTLEDSIIFEENEFGSSYLFEKLDGPFGTALEVYFDTGVIVSPHSVSRPKLTGIYDEAKMLSLDNIYFENYTDILQGGQFSSVSYPYYTGFDPIAITKAGIDPEDRKLQNGNLIAISNAGDIAGGSSGGGFFWTKDGRDYYIGPVIGEDAFAFLTKVDEAHAFPLAFVGRDRFINLIEDAIANYKSKNPQ